MAGTDTVAGFGAEGGFGFFLDESGTDTYEGVPGHADDTRQGPTDESTGLFEDRNSEPAGQKRR